MADKNEYVSARTHSKAYEEGGDVTSSECLASAFVLLGIAEISEDEAEIEPIIQPTTVECENESESIIEPITVKCKNKSEPLTYKAALRSPQARQWKEARCQEWQALVENHTFDIIEKGNTVHTPMISDGTVEEPTSGKKFCVRMQGLCPDAIYVSEMSRRSGHNLAR